MPKQRITKEMVVEAAFEIAREKGIEQVMVKSIAQKIGCSVQPIYSYCNNMDGLREAVGLRAKKFIEEYVASHIDKYDPFRSSGKAYILLAKEEPNVMRLFYRLERKGVSSLNDLYANESNPRTAQIISDSLNIPLDFAKQLHLNMLIYTIGLCTYFSSATPGVPIDEVYELQEQMYSILVADTLKKLNHASLA